MAKKTTSRRLNFLVIMPDNGFNKAERLIGKILEDGIPNGLKVTPSPKLYKSE